MADKLFCSADRPSWAAPIAHWAVWDTCTQSAGAPSSAELGFVEPMLRRRLSPLARMSLKVAHECAGDLPAVRFVYASRHGELTRTTAMLDDLAAGEALSPTAFSLSVLNASAGLFSILRRDTAPATAVSAAGESFGYGLLEACMQLAEQPQLPVLFVYADEPAPEVYGRCEAQDTPAHAIALLLQHDASTIIDCSCSPNEALVASDETQARAFLRCMAPERTPTRWQGPGKSWSWERQRA